MHWGMLGMQADCNVCIGLLLRGYTNRWCGNGWTQANGEHPPKGLKCLRRGITLCVDALIKPKSVSQPSFGLAKTPEWTGASFYPSAPRSTLSKMLRLAKKEGLAYCGAIFIPSSFLFAGTMWWHLPIPNRLLQAANRKKRRKKKSAENYQGMEVTHNWRLSCGKCAIHNL